MVEKCFIYTSKRYRQTKLVSEVENNRLCNMYRFFKVDFSFELYLTELDFSNRLILSKLRCGNLKLPNNLRRFNVVDIDRNCKLCGIDMLGDEFHYLFICKFFADDRSKYINPHILRHQNISLKMSELFNSKNIMVLNDLCKFAKVLSSKITFNI